MEVIEREALDERHLPFCLDGFPKEIQEIGKEAIYTGGWLPGEKDQSYRKKSFDIAKFAEECGISLLRRGVSTVSNLLLPMPVGMYFAEHRQAYQHNKILPSVAAHDDRALQDMLYYYQKTCCTGYQLATVVLAGLDNRVPIDGLRQSIHEAFNHYNRLRKKVEKENSEIEFLTAKLELPFSQHTQGFYLHFHIIVKIPAKSNAIKALSDCIQKNTLVGSSQCLSVDQISPKGLRRAIRYSIKPSTTAWEIAKARDHKTFIRYVAEMKGVRLFRSHGSFSRLKSEIKASGQRLLRVESADQNDDLTLVPSHPREAADIKLASDNPTHNKERWTINSINEKIYEKEPAMEPKNIFFGLSKAQALPGNKMACFVRIGNFNPNSANSEGLALYEDYNALARQAYEINTGRPFDVVEFLKPKAEKMLAALKAKNTKVLHYTVSCSPNVLRLLEHLVNGYSSSINRDTETKESSSNMKNGLYDRRGAICSGPKDYLKDVLGFRDSCEPPF